MLRAAFEILLPTRRRRSRWGNGDWEPHLLNQSEKRKYRHHKHWTRMRMQSFRCLSILVTMISQHKVSRNMDRMKIVLNTSSIIEQTTLMGYKDQLSIERKRIGVMMRNLVSPSFPWKVSSSFIKTVEGNRTKNSIIPRLVVCPTILLKQRKQDNF